jgi:hypothetical protein
MRSVLCTAAPGLKAHPVIDFNSIGAQQIYEGWCPVCNACSLYTAKALMQQRCLCGYLKMWQRPLDWHVCCARIGAASWQCDAAGAGRPAPQTASARDRHLSCAHTPAAECTGQTRAHRLQPASNHQGIEFGELGAEWLAGSDKSTNSLSLNSA